MLPHKWQISCPSSFWDEDFLKLFLRLSLVLSLPTVAPISWGPWFNELESTYPRMLPHKVKLFLPNGFKEDFYKKIFKIFSLYFIVKTPIEAKTLPLGTMFWTNLDWIHITWKCTRFSFPNQNVFVKKANIFNNTNLHFLLKEHCLSF